MQLEVFYGGPDPYVVTREGGGLVGSTATICGAYDLMKSLRECFPGRQYRCLHAGYCVLRSEEFETEENDR